MMEQFGSLNIAKLTYKFDDYFYGNHFINNHNIFIGCICTKGLCQSVDLCTVRKQYGLGPIFISFV